MKQIKNLFLLGIVVMSFYLFSCKKQKDEYANLDCSTISSTYNATIKPLINANCNTSGCHDAGSFHGDFTTYAGLKAAADNGNLNTRALVDKTMPPNGALSLDDRKKIKCWINSGAPNN